MVGKVIVRDELVGKRTRVHQETGGTRATRFGALLASPVGVMIVVPGLVLLVGALSTFVGQKALRETNLAAAAELLAETTGTVSLRLKRTVSQTEGLLTRLDDVARRSSLDDPLAVGVILRDLFLDRAGLTQLYVGYENGRFLGIYEENGEIRFQDSRIGQDGKTTIKHYVLGAQQDLTLFKEEIADYDPRTRDWYREAKQSRGRIWTKPYSFFTTGRTGVTRASPVFSNSGELRAVVGVDYDATALSNLFTDANREWVNVLVSGPGGTILAYPSARAVIEALPRSNLALTYHQLKDPILSAYFGSDSGEKLQGMRVLNVENERYLITETEVSGVGLNWKVVALAPEEVVLGVLYRYQRQSLLIALGAVGIALVVSWFFARHVVRARRQVAQAREEAAHAIRQAAELGSYKLLDCLGKGGMGEVWRAEHRLLARQAAVKLITADLELSGNVEEVHERFKREAKAIAALKSRNTIALFDYGVTPEGTFFYVMEMLDGVDLESLVDNYGPQPDGRVIATLRQVCNSLAEAHDAGLVHRDIKPANLFLCREADEVDVLKVLDFGLVRGPEGDDLSLGPKPPIRFDLSFNEVTPAGAINASQEPPLSSRLTRVGDYLGTPSFMAPEQALGLEIDGRADLYALGCVGFWLLTGQLPFDEPSTVAMLMAQIQKPPVPVGKYCLGVSVELENLILRCMAKQPEERPSSARELAELLRAIPLSPEHAFTEAMAQKWWSRHRPLGVRSAMTESKTLLHSQA